MSRRMRDALLLQFGGTSAIPWYLSGGVAAANCIVAYKPIGAASLAASYINLVNPGTYDATVAGGAGAPDFATATGWQFISANTDILTTSYVPENTVNRSVVVRISGATTDAVTRGICGARNGSAFFGIFNTDTASKARFYNGTGAADGLYTHSTNIAAGVLAVSGLNAYIDGTDVGNIGTITPNYNLGTVAVNIGNTAGVGGTVFNGYVLAFAIYNTTLTPEQVLAISTMMAALV